VEKKLMVIPQNKTKIVCTIGPASATLEVMADMIRAGMNVARLNFSHGDFPSHKKMIENLREASRSVGKPVTIMADLSGPKIRIGELSQEPIELKADRRVTLSTGDVVGDAARISVSFSRLPQAVRPGDMLFLNDGYIQLEVKEVRGKEVTCNVVVGGELRSRQGLNLPGIDLGISAFTEQDHRCLKFALENGVDAVSQSFVETVSDIHAVREASESLGHHPFIIAKIERSRVLQHMEEILEAADGIMIARGDLGVEMPIEDLPGIQKELMRKANLVGKPVITATQMLESMTNNRRPTRAEATDVANAILDGTDCVMLSGESAIGKYPVEAVAMLARIAAAIEPRRPAQSVREAIRPARKDAPVRLHDLIALSVETASRHAPPAVVIVPTQSGVTARRIARFRLPMWITAVSSLKSTCQNLQFSYGIEPVYAPEHPEDWKAFARDWVRDHGVDGDLVFLTEGPSSRHPEANNRMEIIDLSRR
jgi:pyruvate kinase